MFWSLFIFRGHQLFVTMSRVTCSICRPTQQPVLATANTAKTPESFGENAGEWTGKVEISKEESSGSKRSMYGHILTYSRL